MIIMNMKEFIHRGLLLAVVFLLLGALSIHAGVGDLITKQVTVKLDFAGSLPYCISSSEKYRITNLKVVGEINGTDLGFIREMAGFNNWEETDGKLTILDLSETKIVKGGSSYLFNSEDHRGWENGYYPTSNDCLPLYVFYGCWRLESLSLPSSITSIEEYALCGCMHLESLTIPEGLISIGERAFEGCSSLTNISIPSSVTSIGEHAFGDCRGLKSIVLPSSITTIEYGAFYGCSRLENIYSYMESLPKLGEALFTFCNSKECTVYVPKGTYENYRQSEFGYFENIVEFDATGIDKVNTSTNAKEVSRYSVNGQRLSSPAKGLNIVKYSDGSVKKVAIQ